MCSIEFNQSFYDAQNVHCIFNVHFRFFFLLLATSFHCGNIKHFCLHLHGYKKKRLLEPVLGEYAVCMYLSFFTSQFFIFVLCSVAKTKFCCITSLFTPDNAWTQVWVYKIKIEKCISNVCNTRFIYSTYSFASVFV